MRYFRSSFIFTIIGLIGSYYIGHYYGGTPAAGFAALGIAVILAILEISLSFDNAIVNAVVLKEMTPLWRHRFLTWGMLIAVFGMRLIFPVLIVTFAAKVGPWDALMLAVTNPDEYARLMVAAHPQVSAFGGTFLLMVALKYFYDPDKDSHWIPLIEKPVAAIGRRIQAIEIAIALIVVATISNFLKAEIVSSFLMAAIAGLITYVVVEGIGSWLEASEESMANAHKASAGMFLYLEVLDASFSFDGVVGAFAITHNLFIIMIGLSIGAFFVRSLTIMFVEKEALTKFEYLEHGAFYAIGILATIMLASPFVHIPEWVTGTMGAIVIGLSFIWSLKAAKIIEAK